MAYPEQDWRTSFHQESQNRKSLFEAILSPRKSIRPSIAPNSNVRNVKYQFMLELVEVLSEPSQLEAILQQNGVLNEHLVDLDMHPPLVSTKSFLPLEWFDDFDYDPMSAERWLSIDNLLGFALIEEQETWLWKTVAVVDYNHERYLWTVLENGECWEVPRLRLFLIYEDPACFCQRIESALNRRNFAENCLRYAYLRQLIDVGEYFELADHVQMRIAERTNIDVLEAFRSIYRKFHVGLSLNTCLLENDLLNIAPVYVTPDKMMSSCKDNLRQIYSFKHSFDLIRRIILVCHPAVCKAIEMMHQECEVVRKMTLFSLESMVPLPLAEFQLANEVQLNKTMRYLQDNWIERTTMLVHSNLLAAGRGWFDVAVNDWTIYQFMKLHRFTEQIKHRMQTALRDLVLISTSKYYHRLCDACEPCLLVKDDFKWETNLIESPFDSGKQPVFYLLLQMGDETPHYSTNLEEFAACLQTLFDDSIGRTHEVHVIDSSLFGSLIFANNLFLSSMGLNDPVIAQRRGNLLLSYRKSIVPLQAYAARYAEFKLLFFTNVTEYVEEVKLGKTSLQVKEEISFQMRMQESLERTVPLSIVIASFWINVKPLREALIRKRVELTEALLKMLAERLRDKTSDIVSDYNEIIEKMCEKPVSIEHIYEIRGFMDTIPEQLRKLEERMKTVMFEYEILDHFLYALPDPDFYQKWNALAFPQTIIKQTDSVHEFHEGEVDKFRKQQVSDEAGFGSRVESINVYISKFTTVYDVSKVTEVSIEVKKLWKAVNELIQYGETLNKRQKLFEMPPIDLSSLFELKEGFASYKKLWTYAADYINVEQSWRENPLSSVEIQVVAKTLIHYKSSLGNMIDSFADQPQIKDVVRTFLSRVESFEPHLTVIEMLQHPLLEPIHWGQLAKAAGIKVKLSPSANFELFLEHSIGSHLDVLREIISKAEEYKHDIDRMKAEEAENLRKEQEYSKNRELRRLKRTEI